RFAHCTVHSFFFQAEDGIRDRNVTGVQTCALPILPPTSIEPAVGVHRPLSIRISVDFPEPDSPMTTKISPSSTSKLASITAAVPYSLTSSAVAPERNLGRASAARRPNTLYAFLTVIAAMILQSLGSAVAGWGGR